MPRDKPRISRQDSELFRRTVGKISAVKHDRIAPAQRRTAPAISRTLEDRDKVLREMLSDEYEPSEVETGEELLFVRPGIQRKAFRRLRRGEYTIESELDLHGMTVPEARQALIRFLHECSNSGARCVRIIHGKGHGSHQRKPVLKNKVNSWLHQINDVMAFCSAIPADGGTGAVYVLLRRRS